MKKYEVKIWIGSNVFNKGSLRISDYTFIIEDESTDINIIAEKAMLKAYPSGMWPRTKTIDVNEIKED